MSSKGKARFAPGGREYEKRKAANKRRGPRPAVRGEKTEEEDRASIEARNKRKADGEDVSEEGSDEEGSEGEESSEGDESSEGEEGEEGEEGGWKKKSNREAKPKGIQSLIEVENPNRAKKEHIKASEVINLVNKPNQGSQLSRREKEAVEKEKMKNRAEKNDLQRLAQIRKEREEAAKRREEEKKAKEDKEKQVKEGVKKLTI